MMECKHVNIGSGLSLDSALEKTQKWKHERIELFFQIQIVTQNFVQNT